MIIKAKNGFIIFATEKGKTSKSKMIGDILTKIF